MEAPLAYEIRSKISLISSGCLTSMEIGWELSRASIWINVHKENSLNHSISILNGLSSSGDIIAKINWIRLGTPACFSKNLGTPNAHGIDLALKVWSCDIISPMHCLTSPKMVAELWCHQGTFGKTCICLPFLECPTLPLSKARCVQTTINLCSVHSMSNVLSFTYNMFEPLQHQGCLN